MKDLINRPSHFIEVWVEAEGTFHTQLTTEVNKQQIKGTRGDRVVNINVSYPSINKMKDIAKVFHDIY